MAGRGICICIYEIKHKVRRRSSSAAHLAHMTAACSKGSGGGIFRKITKNQLNQARGRAGGGAGATNHTHAATAPRLTPSLKALEKKGKHFYVFPVKSEVEITLEGQSGRKGGRTSREGEKESVPRLSRYFCQPKTGGGGKVRVLGCFPHVSPQTLLRLCCPLLSSLSSCRRRAAAIRAANDANGLNAARSISSSAAKAAAPPSVLSNNLALFMAFSYYPRVIFYATHCGHFPACRKYFDSQRTRERRRQAGRQIEAAWLGQLNWR